jgi:Protein of unknown function (DUF2892)
MASPAALTGVNAARVNVAMLDRKGHRLSSNTREFAMTTNVGTIDRGLRILIGLGLIAWALGYIPNVAASPWGWIGVIPLVTGLLGTCPAYSLIGVNTCSHT